MSWDNLLSQLILDSFVGQIFLYISPKSAYFRALVLEQDIQFVSLNTPRVWRHCGLWVSMSPWASSLSALSLILHPQNEDSFLLSFRRNTVPRKEHRIWVTSRLCGLGQAPILFEHSFLIFKVPYFTGHSKDQMRREHITQRLASVGPGGDYE